MSVRAIQARIECDRETLLKLWDAHCTFHDALRVIQARIFDMRRGGGERTKKRQELLKSFIWGVMQRPAKGAYDVLNKAASGSEVNASARNALNGTATKLAKSESSRLAHGEILAIRGNLKQIEQYQHAFDEFTRGWKPFENIKQQLALIPNFLYHAAISDSVAYIRGHLELTEKWKTDHEAWLATKSQWEAVEENRRYLDLRHRFEEFEEQADGKAGKRRGRWHLYLDWLRDNPDLAAWRGGEPVVLDIPEKGKQKVARAPRWRERQVEADEFWLANPELKALDRIHGFYEKKFVRRRKRKKNPDGFDHRPTFTQPHPVHHPRWIVYSGPQTSPPGYDGLQLPAQPGSYGSIQLAVLGPANCDGKREKEMIDVRFKGDRRLAEFRQVVKKREIRKGKNKGKLVESNALEFYDQHLRRHRSAKIGGAKLIFKNIRLDQDGSLKSATPYLVFTCDIESERLTEKARAIKWSDAKESPKGRRRKAWTPPDGIVTAAVDLGIRHLGFATLGVYQQQIKIIRSRNLWIGNVEPSGKKSKGPDLYHLRAHKRELGCRKRETGGVTKGQRSNILLQDHINAMADDRFKKAARKIISFALNSPNVKGHRGEPFPRADVLLLETLSSLLPDAERERGINRALIEFNRGHLVDRLKEVAEDVGLKVIFVPSFGTSQVCSRCGALGRRYSIRRTDGASMIHFGFVEKLFACQECGYRANSDHNASVNLHRRFADDDAVKSFVEFRALPDAKRRELYSSFEDKLLPSLLEMHSLVEKVPF